MEGVTNIEVEEATDGTERLVIEASMMAGREQYQVV